ncbi:MAG: carboxypeptidase regulatory-like domain-containing protein [Pedobacter sp.]|nr:MAG: carboxypeptidase regulatory-like domain-containing protein [Pedobacter sp.]
MKRLSITVAILLASVTLTMAQAAKTVSEQAKIRETSHTVAKEAAPEGHYCSYCKMNYPESHFPCIMKAIKGKVDAAGKVSFTAGQPIGGIIVKGGRNPGGNLNAVTSENGEVLFNNPSTGNYKFIISLPTNNPNARQAGGPIGGIVVKGGKNPGGQMFTVNSNANGEVILNNLEAGNYKFTVIGPSPQDKSVTNTYNSISKVN